MAVSTWSEGLFCRRFDAPKSRGIAQIRLAWNKALRIVLHRVTQSTTIIRKSAWTYLHLPEVTSMKTLFVVALVALSSSLCIGADLPRSSPEAQGIASS